MVRRRRNHIGAILKEDGSWAVTDQEVRREFINHFWRIYTQDQLGPTGINLPQEVQDCIPKITQAGADLMDLVPTEMEIKWAVDALGPTKAPGPDGINAALIQQHWETFGPVVIKEVTLFFQTGRMKETVGRSNLVLIPKVQSPTMVFEFRPISVCNLLYKIISKIIAKKMQPWMNVLISEEQTTFIPGREISENIVLLREIIHTFKNPSGGP